MILSGSKKMTECLLKLGALPNARCIGGFTPVHGACFSGSRTTLKLLLMYGGDLSLLDDEFRTPIDWAMIQGNPKKRMQIIEYIKKYKESIPETKIRVLNNKIPSKTILKSNKDSHSTVRSTIKNGSVALCKIPCIDESLITYKSANFISYQCGSFTEIKGAHWQDTPVSVRSLICPKSSNIDILLSDVENLCKITHPNILLLMGICQTKNFENLYLIFEPIYFGSLYLNLHERRGSLDEIGDKFVLLQQVSEALVFLHSHNIIFCGLTSHCIQITNYNVAKLSSFEFAIENDVDHRRHRQTYKLLENKDWQYVYNWLSPEVLNGEPVSFGSDLYAFCSVMWEIFIGHVPWGNLNADDIVIYILTKHYQLPIQSNYFTPRIFNILQIGLSLNPDNREISMKEINKLLQIEIKYRRKLTLNSDCRQFFGKKNSPDICNNNNIKMCDGDSFSRLKNTSKCKNERSGHCSFDWRNLALNKSSCNFDDKYTPTRSVSSGNIGTTFDDVETFVSAEEKFLSKKFVPDHIKDISSHSKIGPDMYDFISNPIKKKFLLSDQVYQDQGHDENELNSSFLSTESGTIYKSFVSANDRSSFFDSCNNSVRSILKSKKDENNKSISTPILSRTDYEHGVKPASHQLQRHSSFCYVSANKNYLKHHQEHLETRADVRKSNKKLPVKVCKLNIPPKSFNNNLPFDHFFCHNPDEDTLQSKKDLLANSEKRFNLANVLKTAKTSCSNLLTSSKNAYNDLQRFNHSAAEDQSFLSCNSHLALASKILSKSSNTISFESLQTVAGKDKKCGEENAVENSSGATVGESGMSRVAGICDISSAGVNLDSFRSALDIYVDETDKSKNMPNSIFETKSSKLFSKISTKGLVQRNKATDTEDLYCDDEFHPSLEQNPNMQLSIVNKSQELIEAAERCHDPSMVILENHDKDSLLSMDENTFLSLPLSSCNEYTEYEDCVLSSKDDIFCSKDFCQESTRLSNKMSQSDFSIEQ